MQVIKTKLPGVLIIEPRIFNDTRGYFFETYEMQRYQQHGIPAVFLQDNLSCSVKNVIRGLHYQLEHPQGKLVSVALGTVLDVIVDIRTGSPTFGESVSIELSDMNHKQVYVPPGYAHGYCAMTENVVFLYKCTDYYYPKSEYGIAWNDPDLAIQWPVSQPILSGKDTVFPNLKDVPLLQLPRFVE
jgi:dTDP-4-dehydrorhamnose 3,5-epimerase